MQLVFKPVNGATAGEEKVLDTDFQKFSPSTHGNMRWETMASYLNSAIRKYIIPHVGRAWYDEMASAVQLETELNDQQSEALFLLKSAAAQYAEYESLAGLKVANTDMGPVSQQDREGTARSASAFDYYESRRNAILKADDHLDQLLAYLDSRAKAGDAGFNTYSNSDPYQNEGSDFFRSSSEMEQYLNIKGSRRAFASIIRYFKKAERRYIRPLIGEQFYNELKTEYRTATLSAENEEALGLLQNCLAEYGLYEAIPHISCILQNDGIVIVSATNAFDSTRNSNTIFGQAMIERVQDKSLHDGRLASRELEVHLTTNLDDYPTYRDHHHDAESSVGRPIIGEQDSGAIIL